MNYKVVSTDNPTPLAVPIRDLTPGTFFRRSDSGSLYLRLAGLQVLWLDREDRRAPPLGPEPLSKFKGVSGIPVEVTIQVHDGGSR